MIKSLALKQYRAFQHYRMDGIARVNLLVGKNGTGKTSILEAVQLLSSEHILGALRNIASHRNETSMDEHSALSRNIFLSNITHFFHGGKINSGACFQLSKNESSSPITFEVTAATNEDFQERSFAYLPEKIPLYALEVFGDRYPLTEEGSLQIDLVHLQQQHRSFESESGTGGVHFISAESLELRAMGSLWNKIIVDSRENEVIEAMRILDPAIKDIFFLSESSSGGDGEAILVSFDDDRGRVPLGTTGDGMRRLLALAMSLIQAKKGVLLVDEIDTGLHYSVLGSMWRLIINAARDTNIQVFATTHSLDCVKGLAWLCENHPDLASEVALHKIDRNLDHSVSMDAEQLVIANRQDIEVR